MGGRPRADREQFLGMPSEIMAQSLQEEAAMPMMSTEATGRLLSVEAW